jgi:hypothetical protein
MEQIQQKGSRDGNAIFAQMRRLRAPSPVGGVGPGRRRFNPAHRPGLIPGQIPRKSAPCPPRKDMM